MRDSKHAIPVTLTRDELRAALCGIDNVKDEEDDPARHRALLSARAKLDAALGNTSERTTPLEPED